VTAVAVRPRPFPNGTTQLAGTRTLIRLAARRDRVILLVWLYALTAVVASTAYSLRGLYPTASERVAVAAGIGGNPSVLALYGPVFSPSPGGLVAWRIGVVAAVGAALMSIFTVIRHTRADEEAGRLELVGATVVGRQAALAAGLAVASGACLVLGLLIAAASVALGLPATGSLALGAAVALAGLLFGAVAAISAQLAGTARGARGIAAGLLGLAYLIRAVGDSTSGLSGLTWASPLGWTEKLRPFAGQRWWVAGFSVAVAAGCTVGAGLLASRRDLGAGLLPARPGPPRAARSLRSPLGLAWRLQRGSLLGWMIGFAVTGAAAGSAAKGIGALVTSPQLRQELARLGGQAGLVNAYFVAILGLLGVTAAGYAVSAALRPRTEETGQRAELVLAGPVGRLRWAAGHLVIAALGTVALLAVAGLFAGLAYGQRTGDLGGQVQRLLGAALVQVPAVWLVAALAVALFGLVPRLAVAASWSILGVIAFLVLVGPVIKLSHWVLDASPFTHVPKLPGGSFTVSPLLWLVGLALALAVAGLAGLRRRDLG